MKLQIRVDENGIISDVKFKTFGCGSAIASSSYMTERVKGLSLEEAEKIKNTEIAKELCLPPVKLHCSSASLFYLSSSCLVVADGFVLQCWLRTPSALLSATTGISGASWVTRRRPATSMSRKAPQLARPLPRRIRLRPRKSLKPRVAQSS